MKRPGSQVVGLVTLSALVMTGLNIIGPSSPALAQAQLYKSCNDYKLTSPIVLPSASAAQAATQAATAAATLASAAASSTDDIAFLSIVGADSEACYVASETFLQNNMMKLPAGFNGAVGITKTIQGDIAIDKTNVANSQIGDITINISEFKSDNDRRDGFIRQRFLESNKYPYATLTNTVAVGLPAGNYQDGSPLKFQIEGTLTVHDTKRHTIFDATGSYTNGTLVVTAIAQLKMSDFGISVPEIGNLLKVDDAMQLVVNIVARAAQGTATPTK